MSKYYTAHVSNVGLDAIRSDFKIIVKADSLAQARSGVASRIIDVERATDQEIFEAGKNGNVVLNLSDLPTDENQLTLPGTGPVTHAVDMTQPSAHDGTLACAHDGQVEHDGDRTPVLVGATKSGSAPAWLPRGDAVAQNTGD